MDEHTKASVRVTNAPSAGAPNPVEARLQLAAIIDSSDDAIVSKDLNGIVTSWNAAAVRLFGYAPEEILGRSILMIIPPDLHGEEPEILRKVRSGKRIEHYETRRQRKDGQMVHISLTISPIRDADGRIVGVSKIARDITDRRRTEAALIQSERLAAIGRMAATIAHEVNNPLEAILNLAYLLVRHHSLDEEAKGYAQLLLEEVVRVGGITRQTLSFYRDSSREEGIMMADVTNSVLQLHGPVIDQKSISVEIGNRDPGCVWGRGGEFRQVFTNLVTNSLDALRPGGKLQVRVSRTGGGKMVCVTIADNGTGVPEAIREKIFEPFFSTKEYSGTGLGLWVSHSIVRKYGGSIRMRTSTEPGKSGTVFRVCLPPEPAQREIRVESGAVGA